MLKYQKSAWNLKNTASVPARPWVTKRTETGCTRLKQERTFSGFLDSCSIYVSDTCSLLKHCALFLQQKCQRVCVCIYVYTRTQGIFRIILCAYHTLMLNVSSLKGIGVDKCKTPTAVFKVKHTNTQWKWSFYVSFINYCFAILAFRML